MPNSQAITEFQLSCQKYFMCYVVASQGLTERADKIAVHSPDRSKTIYIGRGHPDEGNWQGSINIGEFLDHSAQNGQFSDQIAKSFVTAMYSEWEELYRHKIANEVGASQKSVKCNLMGDLRLIRICIVHSKSVITAEHEKLKELEWSLAPGELRITTDMFSGLIDQINRMQVRIEPQ